MTSLMFATLLAALFTPDQAEDAASSVALGQPGYYGRLDVGGYPKPLLIYRKPLAIGPVPADHSPIYLRVPAGQAGQWRQHCGKYNACKERVYFVQDGWYTREYVPRFQAQAAEHHGKPGDNPRGRSRDEASAMSGQSVGGAKQ